VAHQAAVPAREVVHRQELFPVKVVEHHREIVRVREEAPELILQTKEEAVPRAAILLVRERLANQAKVFQAIKATAVIVVTEEIEATAGIITSAAAMT
jgi:hypothetical protein